MYWQALRGRLLTRPASYAGVSLMAVTVESGGKLAAQSDRRVNVVATRIYDTGAPRKISSALYHVGNSLGLAMDTEAINTLEETYWTPKMSISITRQETVSPHWKCSRRSPRRGNRTSC